MISSNDFLIELPISARNMNHAERKYNTQSDPIPDAFKSEDEAVEFWDSHSITDYEEFLESVELEMNFKRRHFEIEVDQEVFLALCDSARKLHKPAKQLASEILQQNLAAV